MSNELPTWEEMSDLDKGMALLYLRKVENEGRIGARESLVPEYFDHPVLVTLDEEDACSHAESLFADWAAVLDAMDWDETSRLRGLAREAKLERAHKARDAR